MCFGDNHLSDIGSVCPKLGCEGGPVVHSEYLFVRIALRMRVFYKLAKLGGLDSFFLFVRVAWVARFFWVGVMFVAEDILIMMKTLEQWVFH